jgi:hypothetical protein
MGSRDRRLRAWTRPRSRRRWTAPPQPTARYSTCSCSRTEGLITKSGTCKALSVTLDQAVGNHADGRHDIEHNDVDAFAEQVDGQLGKAIDTATGLRLIAFAEDLIATNG